MSKVQKISQDLTAAGDAAKKIAIGVATAPTAIKATGGFIQGAGSQITHAGLKSAVTKVGLGIHKAGTVLGKFTGAGLKAAAKAAAPALKLGVLGPLAKIAIPLAVVGLVAAHAVAKSRRKD